MNKMINGINRVLLLAMLLMAAITISMVAMSSLAVAEEAEADGEEGGTGVFERPIYIAIKPAFVVNYGGEGKLRYMKVEISLRVSDTHSSHGARHHMPLLRDYLVSLFTRQTDQDIDTSDGKERLRKTALAGVQDVLMREDGEQGVTGLYFSHFVVQR